MLFISGGLRLYRFLFELTWVYFITSIYLWFSVLGEGYLFFGPKNLACANSSM